MNTVGLLGGPVSTPVPCGLPALPTRFALSKLARRECRLKAVGKERQHSLPQAGGVRR